MTETPTWSTLDLDQAVALRTAAGRLARDFDGVFGTQTTSGSCTPHSTSSPTGLPSPSSCR